MCRPTRQRYRERLIRLGEMSDDDAQSVHRGSGGSTYTPRGQGQHDGDLLIQNLKILHSGEAHAAEERPASNSAGERCSPTLSLTLPQERCDLSRGQQRPYGVEADPADRHPRIRACSTALRAASASKLSPVSTRTAGAPVAAS